MARTTVKTVSYRVFGSALTFIISYIYTGHAVIAAGISVTEFIIKPVMYWIHERLWNRVRWGKHS